MAVCSVSKCQKPTEGNRRVCTMHRSRWRNHRSYALPIRKIRSSNRRGHDVLMECLHHGQLVGEQISFSISKKDGPKQSCKQCTREAVNRKKFGITTGIYEAWLLKQGGVCAICKKQETMTRHGKVLLLSIDHCHALEKDGIMLIRGLLCARCNHGLGNFKDDVATLEAAIRYLKDNEV